MAAGCGGGGGGGGGGDITEPPPTGTVVVTGKVVSPVEANPIVGATITYGAAQVVTDSNGEFRIEVPAPSPAQVVRITGPDGPDPDTDPDYFSRGTYGGSSILLGSEGIAVPESAAGATYDFRPIRLYHVRDDPPPPPF